MPNQESMYYKKQHLLKEFKKLLFILEKNNIWYSVTLGTLLGAWKYKGFIPWDDDIDILIKKDGYEKLKKLYPNNILTTKDKGYPLLLPKWVPKKDNIHTSSIFIDLFVLVKTNKERIKKFRSVKNKFRYAVYALHTNYKAPNFEQKIAKLFTYPFKLFIRKNVDYDKELDMLDTNSGDRWYYAVNPIQTNDWSLLPKFFSDETINLTFEGIKVKGIKNYKKWLQYRYKGINMTPPVNKKIQKHINTHSIKYVQYNPKDWNN